MTKDPERCFFDTSALICDFSSFTGNEGEVEKFNSRNNDIIPITSIFVKEEFLHTLATQGTVLQELSASSGNSAEDIFEDVWEKFESYLTYFLLEEYSLKEEDRVFTRILESILSNKNKSFTEIYNSKIPGGKDIVHIATAEACECSKFITADSDFDFLKELELNFQSLSKIIKIDRESYEIEKTIDLSF